MNLVFKRHIISGYTCAYDMPVAGIQQCCYPSLCLSIPRSAFWVVDTIDMDTIWLAAWRSG